MIIPILVQLLLLFHPLVSAELQHQNAPFNPTSSIDYLKSSMDMQRSIDHNLARHLLLLFAYKQTPSASIVKTILRKSEIHQRSLPNAVPVSNKNCTVTIVGDIHGQLQDVLTIFEMNGSPSTSNRYIFNGDLVDRGKQSIEVLILLLAAQLAMPEAIFIARGNHEDMIMNTKYGLWAEIQSKFPQDDWEIFHLCAMLFNSLPLAHLIIERGIFVVHGGLPEYPITIDDIQNINRFGPATSNPIMTNLLWSDPRAKIKNHWSSNPRGVGILFGPQITHKFLDLNNLKLLVRSHEVVAQGFDIMHDGRCITVFSAAKYMGRLRNAGAVMVLPEDDNEHYYLQFDSRASSSQSMSILPSSDQQYFQ